MFWADLLGSEKSMELRRMNHGMISCDLRNLEDVLNDQVEKYPKCPFGSICNYIP